MIFEEIKKRYSAETEKATMGCANLWPYIDLKKDIQILDLGCGRGIQVIELAKKLSGSSKVIGLDLSPAMVEKAMASNTESNAEFVVGQIEALPFAGNSFDLILSNCVINHALDKEKVYQEIFRTLKPGGKFIIGDVMAVEALPESVAKDPKAIAACYGGAIPKENYLHIVQGIGFIHIEIKGSRVYPKHGFLLESIILIGEKA